MHLQRGKAGRAAADADDGYGDGGGADECGAALVGGTDGEVMHGRVCMGTPRSPQPQFQPQPQARPHLHNPNPNPNSESKPDPKHNPNPNPSP